MTRKIRTTHCLYNHSKQVHKLVFRIHGDDNPVQIFSLLPLSFMPGYCPAESLSRSIWSSSTSTSNLAYCTVLYKMWSSFAFQVQLEDNGNILEVKVQHYGDLVPVVRWDKINLKIIIDFDTFHFFVTRHAVHCIYIIMKPVLPMLHEVYSRIKTASL